MIIYASDTIKERVAKIAAAAERTFGLESVGDRCFIKPDLAASCVIRITWRADLIDSCKWTFPDILRIIHPQVVMQGEGHFEFCTFHPVSQAGLMLLYWRRIVCSILGFLVYFPIALGIFLPFILIILCVSGSGVSNSFELAIVIAGMIVGSAFLILGGFRARSFVRRLAQPGSLHAIGDPRIEIHDIEKLNLSRGSK